MEARLGVLGGMGPLATADFLAKLTRLTPASVDQDHIPAVIYSATRTPDRSASIAGSGPSPRQALLEGARFLTENGAACIAIPCNTAHFWHGDIERSVDIPILHIVDAVSEQAKLTLPDGGRLGILGTSGTIAAKVYQNRLRDSQFECLVPTPAELDQLIMPAIALVKAGHVADAGGLLKAAGDLLLARGADRIVMACTEIPPAMSAYQSDRSCRLIDATEALAAHCIRWWQSAGKTDRTPQPL